MSTLDIIDYLNFFLLLLYSIVVYLYDSLCDNLLLLIYTIINYSTFALFDLTTLLTNSFKFRLLGIKNLILYTNSFHLCVYLLS